jgi:creatinine amidohydrolase/Fe(II)-dependent formamide hydrolase-like protein
MIVWDSLFGVPVATKKGGASHELSSNGVWSLSDLKKATKEHGENTVSRMVEQAVKFIEVWKQAKK